MAGRQRLWKRASSLNRYHYRAVYLHAVTFHMEQQQTTNNLKQIQRFEINIYRELDKMMETFVN